MIASGITKQQLQTAADSIGVTLDMSKLSDSGLRHRVKVNRGPNEDYRRVSAHFMQNNRRVNAVC